MYNDSDELSVGPPDLAVEQDQSGQTEDEHPFGDIATRRMREAKFVLDNRPRVRPDASVIDAIVREAAKGVAETRPKFGGLRLISGLSTSTFPTRYVAAASVVLVAVVLGVVQLRGGDSPVMNETNGVAQESVNGFSAEQPAAASETGSLEKLADRELGRRELVAPSAAAPTQVASTMEADAIASQDSIPGWDDETRVRMIQRRIDLLTKGNADLGWDQPAVPLEQVVPVPVRPGVVQAGAKQQ